MTDSLLKSEIMDAMQAEGFKKTEANEKLAAAIAKAVVKHITSMAEVTGGTCAPGGPIVGGKIL